MNYGFNSKVVEKENKNINNYKLSLKKNFQINIRQINKKKKVIFYYSRIKKILSKNIKKRQRLR